MKEEDGGDSSDQTINVSASPPVNVPTLFIQEVPKDDQNEMIETY